MNYLELTGAIIGLFYLYLEYKANIWLWIAGIVMPAIYMVVYYKAGLYADFGINIYYLGASFYGLYCWLKGLKHHTRPEAAESKSIQRTPSIIYRKLTAVFVVLFAGIATILILFTNSTVPLTDSFTTALSIVAMWMLAKKYAEQWLAWILVDVVSCGLYIYKGLYFTSILYALYAVIAVFGYKNWLKLIKKSI